MRLLVYIGWISLDRGIFEMINAASILNLKLLCIGEIPDRYQEKEIKQMMNDKVNNITYLPHIPHDQIVNYIKRAQIGLSILHPVPLFFDAIPVKLFEYMACGIPVVASNFPFITEIINKWKCGIVVNPMKIDEIVAALDFLIKYPEEARKMGNAGRDAIEKEYNWEQMEMRLINLYQTLI